MRQAPPVNHLQSLLARPSRKDDKPLAVQLVSYEPHNRWVIVYQEDALRTLTRVHRSKDVPHVAIPLPH
jgi:hypothetical protein